MTKLLSLSTDIVKFYRTSCDACLAAMSAACNGDTSLLEVLSKFEVLHNYEAQSKLSSVTTLASLKISGNHLPPEAVELIINEFYHSTLSFLGLSNSQFSLQNTISLASVLRATPNAFCNLNLEQCNIDSDGACQLASALCTNDKLYGLGLQYNPIGVKGATAFTEMLRTNHTLVHLNLGYCNIDSDGACQLASALCTNDTLQKLNLQDNPINWSALAEMLLKNKTLEELNLIERSIHEEGTQKLISQT